MEGQPPPVEERRRLREELNEFVESCCRTLEEVTASLGWSLDRLDPGEQGAEEVRGAGVRGPFGVLSGPSPVLTTVSSGGGGPRGVRVRKGVGVPAIRRARRSPGTGPGAPLTPPLPGCGSHGPGTLRTHAPSRTPPAERPF